jgi:ABC-type antimicrobial peptide transport system permease subunit
MVLGESFLLVGAGVAIGLTVAVYAGSYVRTLMFELPTTDVTAIGIATGLVLLLSALAGYLPARHASRVDPMVALHRT